MREVGVVENEPDALLLRDHLIAQEIPAKVMLEKTGWGIWIHREDHLTRAKEEFKRFVATEDKSIYLPSRDAAKAINKSNAAKEAEYRKRVRRMSDLWGDPMWKRVPITFGIIVICCAAAVWTNAGNGDIEPFLYSTMNVEVKMNGDDPVILYSTHGFNDILHGQVWRLITPIFLHFGIFHLVCNMSAMRAFGSMIEYQKGWIKLLTLVLVSAVVSNTAQFAADMRGDIPHPFGGMSGVGFALFGYLWAKGHWRPEERIGLQPNTVYMTIAWFLLCMTGHLGPIANTAHGAGLIVGIIMGLTPF